MKTSMGRPHKEMRECGGIRAMEEREFLTFRDDQLTRMIIGCVIQVHKTLGSGFVEDIYRRALLLELRISGLMAETEKEVRVFYQGDEVGVHRLDLLVEDRIVVELKAVENLSAQHYAQLRSYLNAMDLETGLLINFATPKADFRRIGKCGKQHPKGIKVRPEPIPITRE